VFMTCFLSELVMLDRQDAAWSSSCEAEFARSSIYVIAEVWEFPRWVAGTGGSCPGLVDGETIIRRCRQVAPLLWSPMKTN